jgi:hypothetical protein
MENDKIYLYDGVYIENQGFQFRLYTEDGMEIYLERRAIKLLNEFVKKCSENET